MFTLKVLNNIIILVFIKKIRSLAMELVIFVFSGTNWICLEDYNSYNLMYINKNIFFMFTWKVIAKTAFLIAINNLWYIFYTYSLEILTKLSHRNA